MHFSTSLESDPKIIRTIVAREKAPAAANRTMFVNIPNKMASVHGIG